MPTTPKRQRVAAYAVIVRDDQILLSRLSPMVTAEELWTLPGGGLDHGEDPRDAVVREVHEETGLDAEVSDTARVYSAHMPQAWRSGRRVDAHAVRIVYEGWVPPGSPEPRVVEVDGSTMEAAWLSLADVRDGTVPVTPLVTEALADHRPFRRQRVTAYGVIRRADELLLTRVSARGFHTGLWNLPGGGVDHGESPADALVREVREECGVDCEVGELLAVHDDHFSGVAPTGRFEDFHSVQLIFRAELAAGAEPRLAEVDGTTDAVEWISVADIASGAVPVYDAVRAAL
jgi:ADP-ribose pyrophosphatase YjhB (NUDIX family)